METPKTHNGFFTIKNPVSGKHKSFRVKTQRDNAKFAPGRRVVSIKELSSNGKAYMPFGFINSDGSIFIWGRFDNKEFKSYSNMLTNPNHFIEKYELEYTVAGMCRRCNKKLTDPASIKSGIGPICGKK